MTRVRLILALACICAVPQLATAQDKDEAFRRGLSARGDRKWADVVRHMQDAL